jgi:hypothetical protein
MIFPFSFIGAYGSSEAESFEYSHGEYGGARRRENEPTEHQFSRTE